MEPEGSDSRSARKRQKVDVTTTSSSSTRQDWHTGPHSASKYAGFARRDSYNKGDRLGSREFGYPDDATFERSRDTYDREYPNYASENANWKQRGSTWYDDYASSGAAYESSVAWGNDARYRDYPAHEADSYSTAAPSGLYRSNSGRLDGYGYDGYYRSSSVERGDAYINERSATAPSSSGHAYYGSSDGYASSRYGYPQGGFENSRYEAQVYSSEGQGTGRFGKTGRFGFSSAYRTGNAEAATAAGGRYANAFKAKQYSFGNKKVNKNKANTPLGAAGGRRSTAVSDGEAQQEQKEPEKPKVIDDAKVKDYLALRSTLLDYHLTMALLKLNLKPDLDMRKELLDQKMADAGICVAPEVSKESAPAAAMPAAASMPAPEQLSRVNSVEVKQKPIPGTNLARTESAGPAALKREVSGVKRQNTWNDAVVSLKDADAMSVTSAMSGKEETKSEYGPNKDAFPNRGTRDSYPSQPDSAAQPVTDGYDRGWKAPLRSRDTSSTYPADAMPTPATGSQRDARQTSRERSAQRSRSRSHVPPVATGYTRDTSAAYAGGHDSRDRPVARGHSRDHRDGAYDYPVGGYYNYPAASAYPAADHYPDDRYGYDAYAYSGYDDRGYSAYPAYDRYDQYASGRAHSRDRGDYGYNARGAYGAAPANVAAGRYDDRRDGASGRSAGSGGDRNGGRGNTRTEGLVRQGSAGSVASHRSRSRSPPTGSGAEGGGRPPRGAPGVEASDPKHDKEISRDTAQSAPPSSIARTNSRGAMNQSGAVSQPAAAVTPMPAMVAAVSAAPAAPRAATPSQEREPGESSPISTPEAPQTKRIQREVIVGKPQNQFQNQSQNQQPYNKGCGGGGAQGFKGKQGQSYGQQGGGNSYGQNQGLQHPSQQQGQGHYGHQGQGQQGGHSFTKHHNNKFQKNGSAGQGQGQGQGQQNNQGGAGPGPKPSPGKKPPQAAVGAAVTEVAPLRTPR